MPADSSSGADLPLPPPSPDGAFTDVTLAAGIDARHRLPKSGLSNLVDAMGSGAAFGDLDGDGWLDLVVLGGPRSPDAADDGYVHAGVRVYRNLRNGRFVDITADSGIPPDSTGVAVAIADVDGDRLRDLLIVDRGPNRLYRNRGDAVFEDVTDAAGVGDPRFGIGAVFFDLEGDGDLDLYVTNYLEFDPSQTAFFAPNGFPGPRAYSASADVLYRNQGDGRFEDISVSSGVDALSGRGMSVAAIDVDDDHDPDIFVANDVTANFLLLNDGGEGFSEAGLTAGVAIGGSGEETSAMATDVGDVDGDGQLDLVVSDTAFGAYYRRVYPGFFVDDVMRAGIGPVSAQFVSWGQNLLDYDNDGDLDLFIANGGLHHLVGWEDLLLRNAGGGQFEDASLEGGEHFGARLVSRSSITADYDSDGDIDLFITNLDGGHVLLRNDAPPGLSWITLDLEGRRSRDAFGARIELDAGGRTRIAEARCPTAYLGQSDPRVHFGLGAGVDTVDEIRIVWPDGTKQTLTDVPARQILVIREQDAS
ncbi:MAG: CRTAC1 family protein [Acidobacteriota bacterium]